MDVPTTLGQLGLALVLGLLVGMQRERAESRIAGVRTFPLITIFGTVAALLADQAAAGGAWIIAAAFLALCGVIVIGNLTLMQRHEERSGVTTEVAMLVMFGVGASLVGGSAAVAAAIAGAVVLLLHAKELLHGAVQRLGEKDVRAIMQFVLITCIILPILPDETYGPFDVLNPHEIWLMVVLVVGMSLAGYIAYKFLGAHVGTALGGFLGGLVSSTATTVSFARRASGANAQIPAALLGIMIASCVVWGRVLVEIGIVAPRLFRVLGPPIAVLLVASAIAVGAIWFAARRATAQPVEPGNPSELKSALFFGALYAIVVLAVAAMREFAGAGGMYAVAALSGLTDMDAITLSTARLATDGGIEAGVAWRAVVIAGIANMAFKAGIVAVLSSRGLFWRVAGVFGLVSAVGVAVLVLWPDAAAAAALNGSAASAQFPPPP